MPDHNRVNVQSYNYKTKFGVKALIQIAKNHAETIDQAVLVQTLTEALSYYTEGRDWPTSPPSKDTE